MLAVQRLPLRCLSRDREGEDHGQSDRDESEAPHRLILIARSDKSTRAPAAAQDAGVAGAAREAVGVEALEQELRRPARAAEQVAEACKGDAAGTLAFRDERLAGAVVRGPRDGRAVADTDEPAL